MVQCKKLLTSLFASVLLLLGSFIAANPVLADELVISGNGSDSANTQTTTSNTTATVTTDNTTHVTNNVHVDANTGANTDSGNAGDATSVQTGSISTDTSIANSANTTNTSPSPCCSASGTMVFVTGNGSGSSNKASNTSTQSSSVSTHQVATVTNVVNGTASTGGNTANNNTGTVTIKTGNISVGTKITSGPLNVSTIRMNEKTTSPKTITIAGNGQDTTNSIDFLAMNDKNITVHNVANIFNNVLLSLSTGDNTASGNTGSVAISTGDIAVDTEITNGPINVSEVTVDCPCKEKEKPHEQPNPAPPVEKVTPQTPQSSDRPTSGEVASVMAEKILPVTGINWLVLAIIGNVMMLFLGMILRLRSGNSPGVVRA